MFRFPGVEREDDVFSSCFSTCCLYFEGGVEGGGRTVGYIVVFSVCLLTTLGMLLLLMVVVLARELSLAMASSLVWGFAGAKFGLLLLPLCKVK